MTESIGTPMLMCMGLGASDGVYGRILSIDGGVLHLVTPGDSVLFAGRLWFRSLDDDGMERLREFEAQAKVPYGGRLTPEQMGLDRHGNVTTQIDEVKDDD